VAGNTVFPWQVSYHNGEASGITAMVTSITMNFGTVKIDR